MKSTLKTVCIAAGMAGAFFLGGAAHVLLLKFMNKRKGNDPCRESKEEPETEEKASQEDVETEVNTYED